MAPPRLLEPVELAGGSGAWSGPWRGADVWAVLRTARDGDADRLGRLLAADPTLARARYWYTPPLHFAVREGHLAAARLLVGAGASLAYRSLYGDTLLEMALDRGHEAMAAFLVGELERRHGSDGRRHPIHDALERGSAAAVDELLTAEPALAGRGDALGRRPLHYAVAAGRRDLVDLLLDHGAEIDAPGFGGDDRLGGDGFRPIVLALWRDPYWGRRDDRQLAAHLLARGARRSITVAAALGDEERVCELLANRGASADEAEAAGKRPLSAAAERNHLEIVGRLLEAGADPVLPEGPNCPRGYALWAAARHGYHEVAERLLAAGADPNAPVDSSGTPIECAADGEMRRLLARHGGRPGLASLASRGRLSEIAALLDAEPERFDEVGRAEAFTLAVSGGHEELVRLLLARGLEVPRVVTCCQTYLWQSLELARLLLEHGMDADLPNWQQIRPLHHLAAAGEIAAARLFLAHGADPRAVDEEYRSTPLGWAARAGQTEFVRFWLTEGPGDASPAQVPAWARPVAWAERRGHRRIIELLSSPRPR